MKRWTVQFKEWFFKIENEIMLPFIAVGILVIGAFAVISAYNGYTMQMEEQKSRAQITFQNVNMDLLYMKERLTEAELEEKYSRYGDPSLRITAADGRVIAGEKVLLENQQVIYVENGGNFLDWKLEYILDKEQFFNELLEEQMYVIVGAVACLLIIVQVSVFLAWSLTRPIRSMSAACREIDENRKDYRKYRFTEVERRDEIGQLARTLETLLKNLDNYTKMEYTSRMSAALAHEIKNPLTGIRSGVQVLKGRVEKENEKLLCDSMLHEIDRVTGLINDLFTLSAKKENHKQVVSLKPLFEEMDSFYERGLEQQGISFSVRTEDAVTVYADENELRQIIHNLVTNSIKALHGMENGTILLEAEEKDRYTAISITDNGKGMTKEELERAMEPFYTQSINGVGLGLSIVEKLMEQNHGYVEMESEPGRGTTVRLVFDRGENDR